MPMRLRINPIFQPVGTLTASWAAGGGVLLAWVAPPAARGYHVYRRSAAEEAEQPGNPFNVIRLTATALLPTVTSFLDFYEPEELASYTYWVSTVRSDGSETSRVQVDFTTPKLVPQNQLALWNRDFSQQNGGSGWMPNNAAITVTGSPGSQTITFTAASQGLIQTMPANLKTGVYTFWYELQGTAGQTIQFAFGDQQNGTSGDYLHTFDGTVQQLLINRTFSSNGVQGLKIGPNTYGGATARSFTLKRMAVSAGTFTAAQMAAAWELTQGPGSTWQEPKYLSATEATSSLTTPYGGWHRSLDPTNAQAAIYTANSASYSGARTVSRFNHFRQGNSSSSKVKLRGCRSWGRRPGVQGAMLGYWISGDYPRQWDAQNCYAYRTAGMACQYYTGIGAGEGFKFLYNFFREIDGRRYNADGTTVKSAWSDLHVNNNEAPLGIPSGRGIANIMQFHKIQGSGSQSTSVSNPTGDGLYGAEFAWNVVLGRPGWSTHEDLINYNELRGMPTDPVRTHDCFFWTCQAEDYEFTALVAAQGWPATIASGRAWNYGRIKTPHTTTVTTSASVSSGTVLQVNTLTAPIPTGTTMTFGGVSVTTTSEAKRGYTTINVQSIPAPIASGLTWTSGTLMWGPSMTSATGVLLMDGSNLGHWEQNGAYHQCYRMTVVGIGLIISDQGGGNDRDVYDCEQIILPTLADGVTPVTHAINYSYQFTNYNTSTTTATDLSNGQQLIQQKLAFFTNRSYGGSGNGSGAINAPSIMGAYTWKSAGNANFPALTIEQCYGRLGRLLQHITDAGKVLGPAA